jgi:hypothetical protein
MRAARKLITTTARIAQHDLESAQRLRSRSKAACRHKWRFAENLADLVANVEQALFSKL